jgi:hypothetical protein
MKIFFLAIIFTSILLGAIGEVTTLKGKADLSRNTNVIMVTKGLKIEQKDLLETKAESKAQVILNDDTVITIGPQSTYLFEHYQEGKERGVTMRLQHGFFKAVTGKIGKLAPQRFKIKTKAATIGVRGTQFMAYVTNDEEKIGCIQGSIIVWTDEGEFIVNAGEMIHYIDKKWRRKVLDIRAFEPVMVGMVQPNTHYNYQDLFLPRFQQSYLLQEQILNDLQSQDPFSFALDFDATQQPPSFNP